MAAPLSKLSNDLPWSPNCIVYLGSHITHICNTSSESYDSMFCGTIDRSKFPWHQALDMREKQTNKNQLKTTKSTKFQ